MERQDTYSSTFESSVQFQTLIHGFDLLVLDKCDRLLETDLYFFSFVWVLESAPHGQTMLVSATVPQEMLILVDTARNETMFFFFSTVSLDALSLRAKSVCVSPHSHGLQRHRGEHDRVHPELHDHDVFPLRSFYTLYGAPFPWETQNVHDIMDVATDLLRVRTDKFVQGGFWPSLHVRRATWIIGGFHQALLGVVTASTLYDEIESHVVLRVLQ